jgi:hypothetical protein
MEKKGKHTWINKQPTNTTENVMGKNELSSEYREKQH